MGQVIDPKIYHNRDAEMAVLGGVLQDQGWLGKLDSLEERDFRGGVHRHIFRAMVELNRTERGIDYLTIEAQLRENGVWGEVGNASYLAQLTDVVPTSANIAHYADIVRRLAKARRLRSKLHEVCQELDKGASVDDVFLPMSRAIDDAQRGVRQEVDLDEVRRLYEDYQDGTVAGKLTTGFQRLDRYAPATDELVVVAARPSIGKTALMCAMADAMSLREIPTLILSMEMSAQAIFFRRLAALSGVPATFLRSRGGVRDHQTERVGHAFEALKGSMVRVVSGAFSLVEALGVIRTYAARYGVRAVFLDHLGKLKLSRRERQDVELGEVTSSMADTAKELGISVYLLHQLNRKCEEREDKRPRISDLRDSGYIEQDADVIWLLYRDSRYRQDADSSFEVICGKQRNGPVGTAQLRFEETTGQFQEDVL